MSISKGIEIRKKDPTKERPYNERPETSWTRWYDDMWIGEWLRKYETKKPPEYHRRLGEYEWEASIRKEDLLRMADDLINRRFDVCPDAYDWFEGEPSDEDRMADFGDEFKALAERLAEDEMLVFYDHGY